MLKESHVRRIHLKEASNSFRFSLFLYTDMKRLIIVSLKKSSFARILVKGSAGLMQHVPSSSPFYPHTPAAGLHSLQVCRLIWRQKQSVLARQVLSATGKLVVTSQAVLVLLEKTDPGPVTSIWNYKILVSSCHGTVLCPWLLMEIIVCKCEYQALGTPFIMRRISEVEYHVGLSETQSESGKN